MVSKETKLGMLVALGIILLIGILISDHLSWQRKTPPADLSRWPQVTNPRPPHGAHDPPPRTSDQDPPSDIPGTTRTRKRIDPIPLTTPLPPPEGSTSTQPPRQPEQSSALQHQPPLSGTSTSDKPHGKQFDPSGNRVRSSGTDDHGAAKKSVNWLLKDRNRPQVTQRKGQIIHTVEKGETVWGLAQKYFHSGQSWPLIRKANLDKVGPQGQVRLGAKLIIPRPRPSTSPAAETRQRPQGGARLIGQANKAHQVPALAPNTIKVTAGQTLSELAQEHLGSSRLWPELLKANRDQLHNPKDLREGMTIRLPKNITASRRTSRGPVVAPRTQTPAMGDSRRPTPRTAGAGHKPIHKVKQGDSLSLIAEKHFGDPGKWRLIYQANRDKLSDPDVLPLHMILTIPAQAR